MRGDDGQPKRGEPAILFVAAVTEAERDKALADAFKKAKVEAARLARAAGAELGALHQVQASSQLSTDTMGDDYAAYTPAMRAFRRFGYGQQTEIADEAMGVQPGRVAVRFTVNVSFDLKSGTAR